jgi:hypothetical protein
MDQHDDTIDETERRRHNHYQPSESGHHLVLAHDSTGGRTVVAEGSITGPEEFIRIVMNATGSKLVLQDDYVLMLQCEGGATGA